MRAMIIHNHVSLHDDPTPLELVEIARPAPQADQVLLRVSACGVCHTELDEIEGRARPSQLPVIPGHQVVGVVVEVGPQVKSLQPGERVGVPWIYAACGECSYCQAGLENLCPDFQATGMDANGGYAEYMLVRESFAHPIPSALSDLEAAPLLCAGAIGYRSLRLAGIENGHSLGLTGFGASAHLVLKLLRSHWPATPVYVFTRNPTERDFALELGAVWGGDTADRSPVKLDAIIDTTPAWKPVVEALANLKPSGRLVINAIRKEPGDQDCLLDLDYPAHLWLEKEVKTVANVTRRDVREFLDLAAEIPLHPEVQTYPLEDANKALLELKHGQIRGAKVLAMATVGVD